ncbi:MAG TPA: RIO1 family regulatory kinase/ATPase [candidate division Zixibacteria bacterium]|nr:RIO1 family regulatory kinase/ATPase [candidate division Zixibacteria bacterium]
MDLTQSDFQEEFGFLEKEILQRDRQFRRKQKRHGRPALDPGTARKDLTDLNDHESDFVPSYAAALDPLHFERQWVIDSVGGFYRDNLITDVTRLVKGGKEANVYCCVANPDIGVELVAAKLYRPRMLRHLRNDALYREGRMVLDSDGKEVKGDREGRAMRKKTRFGKHLGFMTWIMHEYGVQRELFDDGADVPRPIAQQGNTILMDYIGDDLGPAPTLSEVSIDPDEAQPLLERTIKNIRLMLEHNYVHGDLSAYNILYWEGDIMIIDFPQMVDARKNGNAFSLLQRDVQRVCEYYVQNGATADPTELTLDLWEKYSNGLPL